MLVIVATSLYLLERLEPVLRPLLIAVLLSYLFLPVYTWLRRYMRPVFSFLIIAVGITLGLQGLARMVYRDVVLIDHNLPRYMKREAELENHLRELSKSIVALAATARSRGLDRRVGRFADQRALTANRPGAATAFLSVFLELFVVAFYMIFLLQSASRLPSRIRSSFSPERAKGILEITQSINRAISEYLVVKVKASLLVGIPVALACWAFGITGAVTWGMITFFGNFLPYSGPWWRSFLPSPWRSSSSTHSGRRALRPDSAVDPRHHGQPDRAGDDRQGAGLSPLIVLIGLAFWSLLWGFVGMVLAVPLTVIFKIVLEHTPATRPLAHHDLRR